MKRAILIMVLFFSAGLASAQYYPGMYPGYRYNPVLGWWEGDQRPVYYYVPAYQPYYGVGYDTCRDPLWYPRFRARWALEDAERDLRWFRNEVEW